MSQVAIQAALEQHLTAALSGFNLVGQNETPGFSTDDPGDIWGEHFTLFAQPITDELTSSHAREHGYMQVNLQYPKGVGVGAAQAKAEAIRDAFLRASAVTATGGLKVVVDGKPEIGAGFNTDIRFVKPVYVRFYCDVTS